MTVYCSEFQTRRGTVSGGFLRFSRSGGLLLGSESLAKCKHSRQGHGGRSEIRERRNGAGCESR